MKRLGRVMLLVLVVAACAGCDQATKTAAKALLPSSGAITVLHNTITLVYTENPGAFLSLGARLSEWARFALFTVAAGLILTVAFAFLLRSHGTRPWQDISLALIIGGGVGNLIDRLGNQGCVVDFIRLGVVASDSRGSFPTAASFGYSRRSEFPPERPSNSALLNRYTETDDHVLRADDRRRTCEQHTRAHSV